MSPAPPGDPRVFLSYAREDGEAFATRLRKRLEQDEPEITLWQDRAGMEGGVGWWRQIEEALHRVRFLVIVMTPAALASEVTRREWRLARQEGVVVYPVKGVPDDWIDYGALPSWIRKAHFFDLEREWETFVNYLKSDRSPARVPFMAPEMPDGFVARPREADALIALLLDAERGSPVAITTALQGAGGYGKTTLARALCHDERIVEVFDDGILWATLGQTPNLIAELAKLYEALTGEQPAFVDVAQAARKLGERLESKNCLLVIDDVWDAAHLDHFLQGGKGCARLITTRRFDVTSRARRIDVDEMSPDESVRVLTSRLDSPPDDLEPLRRLARRLGDWPLLLRLAASALRVRIDRRDDLEGAIEYVNRAFEKRGIAAFDPKDPEQRRLAAAGSIEVSMALLDENDRRRFTEMAIFPEDVEIPLGTLGRLWGTDDLDTEECAQRLHDLALLESLDLGRGILKLHDVMRSYLEQRLGDARDVHRRLVDAWGDPKALPDAYAWRWIGWHLVRANRLTDLHRLLFDFEWLLAKLKVAGPLDLIADYDLLDADEACRLVQSALRLSIQPLTEEPALLAQQILGRLAPSDCHVIETLRQDAIHWRGQAWLRPLTPSLTRAGGSTKAILKGHRGSVKAVVVTPDGRRAVSASRDNTLRLWDLDSGRSLQILEGHSGPVSDVVITPDGRRAVSASDDNTLRVWDLDSGRSLQILQGHSGRVFDVVITPDGRRAVSASWDHTLRVWDLDSGRSLQIFEGHWHSVHTVAITPDGCRAVSASWDQTLRLWDLDSGRSLQIFEGHSGPVSDVVITPDGRRAVSVSSDNTLRVWDLDSGRSLQILGGHSDLVNAVAITPDGRGAVSASDDDTLRVWDLNSGRSLQILEGHSGSVYAVAITPDSCRAVSASVDNTLRVWDLASGNETARFAADAILVCCATGVDGRAFVAGDASGRVHFLKLEGAL